MGLVENLKFLSVEFQTFVKTISQKRGRLLYTKKVTVVEITYDFGTKMIHYDNHQS